MSQSDAKWISSYYRRTTAQPVVTNRLIVRDCVETTMNGHRSPNSSHFANHEIIRELARGRRCVVILARRREQNRLVALKIILASQLPDPAEIKRFFSEAQAAANLDHPGIVSLFEVGQYEGHHYFAMGFVDGTSLAQRLAEGPLPVRQAAELIQRVSEAIESAHDRGVIHCDLEPSNILLDQDGNPHVTDFGCARQIHSDSEPTDPAQMAENTSYMPPEQVAGQRGVVGPGSDIYSLGATLYASITGRPPFQAATPTDTARQIMSDEPIPPAQLDSSIPRDLETICLKCLEKEPGKRYATATALAEDLRRFLSGEAIVGRR